MATGAQVTLRGRFSPGSQVTLVKVGSEATLRAEGGEPVAEGRVDKNGVVSFTSGVEVGARYFVVGLVDGQPLEVRARGRAAGDGDAVLGQAPVGLSEARFSNGELVDSVPEAQELPKLEAAPNLSQQQAGDVVQRSATPRGSAHPVDEREFEEGRGAPYPVQESLPKGAVQMSDTRSDREGAAGFAGGGMATPTDVGPQRQEDVGKGVWQRSATVSGVATVIPSPPVRAQTEKESAEGKVKRGEPVKAAAAPLGGGEVTGASERRSDRRDEKLAESEREARETPAVTDEGASGLDAVGQPADEGVARAGGFEPASKPAEPVRASKRKSE